MLTTKADVGWPAKDTGREFSIPFVSPAQALSSSWDFVDPTNPVGSLVSSPDPYTRQINGVLWTQVVTPLLNSYSAPAPISDDMVKQRSATYAPGNASVVNSCQTINVPQPHKVFEVFCKECPMHITDLFNRVGNPGLERATPNGLVSSWAMDAATEDIYESAEEAKFRLVDASEPITRLFNSAAPGASVLRGIGIDANAIVTAIVSSAAIDAVTQGHQVQDAPHGVPPALAGNEGLILSAQVRQLFVIPAPEGGRGTLTEGSRFSIYDVDAVTWTDIAFTGTGLPGMVLDGFYRLEDGSLYVLDDQGDALRLYRIEPLTGASALLGTMPASWRGYDHVWLTQGEEGDILLSVSQTAPMHGRTSLLARFTVGASGAVTFAGLVIDDDGITLARPHLGAEGATRMVDDASGAKLKTVDLALFQPGDASDTPEMVR